MNQLTEQLIKDFESLHDGDLKQIGLQPKLDSVGIWTEGWGHAMIDNNKNFIRGIENKKLAYKYSVIKTIEQAEQQLKLDLITYSNIAKIQLGEDYWNKLYDNRKGALTMFVMNCGTHNRKTKKPYLIFETIRKYIDGSISQQDVINYWEQSVIKGTDNTDKLVTLNGLVRRRKAEVNLFFTL